MDADSAAEQPTDSDAAAEWLLGRINYERSSGVPYLERQLKLDRMRQLVTALGSPDAAAPIIHIAGTKGKGSTSAMLAAMLTAAGYKTGVYSSPHLERLEERFAIDGQPISSEQLAEVVACVRPVVEDFDQRSGEATDSPHDGSLTFFDIATAIALVHFAQQECGAVVLEVGLGGRLDSTNICLPAVSVITSISLDHTRQLGNTLAAIAAEKAGIVKPGVPVVSGVIETEPREVIASIARERSCRLVQRGRDFRFDYQTSGTGNSTFNYYSDATELTDVTLALAGEHQAANAAVALAVVDELNQQGWNIDPAACRLGLKQVQLPGRIELLPGEPQVVLDTAHNAASAAALATTLAARNALPRTLVIACSTDKDVAAIAAALAPVFERIVVTQYLDNPRATPREELAETFRKALKDSAGGGTQTQLEVATTPCEAWQRALEITPSQGTVCVAGSFYLTAELRPVVLAQRGEA